MAVLLDHEMEWFRSEQGIATFNNISKLEDRIFFILAFLKSVIRESDISNKLYERFSDRESKIADINKCSSMFALFMADAIYGSDLPYATYPDLIDPEKNPFLNYWISIEFGYRYPDKSTFSHFSNLIEEENEKLTKGKNQTLKQELMERIGDNGSQKAFYDIFLKNIPNKHIHDLNPSLQLMELKNKWIYF